MSLNAYQKACAAFFAALVVCWAVIFFGGVRDTIYNSLFVFAYGLIPLLGGALAAVGYRKWGGLSTILGKAILLLGFGLFLWGLGESVWAYYNIFLGVEVPYPSLADVFFAPSVFFYTLGTIYLSRTTGISIAFKKNFGKLLAVIIPVVAIAITYYLLVVVGKGGELFSDKSDAIKAILDIAYPLGDAVSLTVAAMVASLSFRYLGGMYKYDVVSIILGLAAMYAADSYLSYTSTVGTAFSGDFGDLLFTLAVFLLTFGLLGFNKIKLAENMPAD